MSKNLLASYVEEFILNPAKSRKPNIDDDGNEETVAVCDKKIEEKSAKEAFASVSKLRQKNAQLLGEADPRYRGKKTSRKSISKVEDISYDPELAKFCMIEEDEVSDEEHSQGLDDEKDDISDEDFQSSEDENEDFENNNEKAVNHNSLNYMRMAEDDEELNDEDESEEENDSGNDEGYDKNDSDEDDDSDYGEDEELLDNECIDDNLNKLDKEDNAKHTSSKIQTFSKNETVEMPKGIAVKNQCYIFDKLFEARIGLQKVASISNQLPQFEQYKTFLENAHYPLYKEKLLVARKEIKKLLAEIVKLQGTITKNNRETAAQVESEESKLEEKSENDEGKESKGVKRKLDEFEEILTKRHKKMIPFRDETLNKWHEKSKLLVNQSKKNFGKFEISPSVQIKNILMNKDDLVKKTRLIGVTRGVAYKIMGKEGNMDSNLEEYDSEIFDDSDFYKRMLEDFLKSKISVSKNMTEVSMHWVGIQKLRNKSKKKVEAKASKGRKLRHLVVVKQQNFMAPCKYSVMTDEATNKLFSSLFGGSVV